MWKTKPAGVASLSSTVRALGWPWSLVATTMAVGSGSTPRSLAAKASSSHRSNSAYGSAGTSSSSRWSPT